ncbi:regulator of volume decrease after cellular swelling-domain-containing protein [Annulohypoxylon maeteangense]|uniref:regulator of volume decrease after cellular swelling-domain-containing protein n=1 Tax=Annulohypoxylon maeteangense TaxID=1927788 RepID=UPI0020073A2B|nr:regulator of volume decrease after cellular swelling-domain-containing protein [Annulohypoxylon maeteangense]KAI0881083.1 regulator of volume decrease after cellular swelling-domain-containing protein [Annulohypoxylon maeteangense]
MIPPTVIRSCPSADNDFQPLTEYQAQTPETFFDGKPVLYFHDENVKAWVSKEQDTLLYIFSKPSDDANPPLSPSPPESYALENNGGQHMREEKVEVFVASNKLTLFSHRTGTGIEIPYPAITLHAVKNFRHVEKPDDASFKFTGVYMQIDFPGSDEQDEEGSDPIELTLIPFKALPEGQSSTETPVIDPVNNERATALFNQLSACSNLHPDPQDEEDDAMEGDGGDFDSIIFEGNVENEAIEGLPGAFRGNVNGGLPPPMPGSSGWITADNVSQYFDEDGNWIGGEGVSGELGDGAGRVRGRDEVEEDGDDGQVNGDDADSKRPRTE